MIVLLILVFLIVPVSAEVTFLEKAFVNNQHLAWHVYGGTVITLALLKFTDVSKVGAVFITFGVSLLYEVIEYITDDVYKIYGSKKMYYGDTFGDIVGAGVASITVVIMI